MRSRTVLLFPGLGAYSAGMLRQANRTHPQISEVFKEIDTVAVEYGVPALSELLFEQSPSVQEMLGRRAEVMQLAIFGGSVAVHRVLAEGGVEPVALVGHSFGEIAALVAGGAFSLADGARLVCARTAALVEFEGNGAMAAVATHESVARHLMGVLDDSDLVIGCYNAPRQTVLSGPVGDIERAESVARALNLSCTRLNLPYASHHPSMRAAVDRFTELAREVRQQPLRDRVVSPVHGRRYTDDDDLVRLLGECLVLPVRFTDAVRSLHARGADTFIETGAMRALTRCVQLTVPAVRTFAPLEDPEREPEALREAVAAGRGQAAPVEPAQPAESMESNESTEFAQDTEPARPVDPAVHERIAQGTAPDPAPDTVSAPDPQQVASREQVLERLRELYAAALEYPPDVLTEDARFEADLGVDSLKQTALLRRVVEEFDLGDAPGSLNLSTFETLSDVAEHVLAKPARGASS
ncbi:acyltransferase domain-containing protein [Streptomyces sp. NPDC002838]|uniref:acyltransferase domain-containing protein n=1 Tax=Streptomyces sp. NPDC002838 TaxID=3154436 RepID=UPI00331F65A2